MALRIITEPVLEPLTLQEAKDHLRRDDAEDDSYIEPLIALARSWCEDYCWRTAVNTVYEQTLDCFPCWAVALPRAPLVSVASIAYIDTAGGSQVLSPSFYTIDTKGEPGRVTPAYGTIWPVTQSVINAVTITFTAGFGTNPEKNVPPKIKHALRLLLGHLYEHREAVSATSFSEIPLGIASLLPPRWS